MSRRRRDPGGKGRGAPGAAAPGREGPAPAPPGPSEVTAARAAVLVLAAALWTTLAELIPAFVAPLGGVVVRLSPDFAWMAPLGNLLFFVTAAGLLLLFGRVWPVARSRSAVVGLLAGSATLALGSAVERLHPAAVLLLAVGVGAQAGRMAAGPPRWPRFAPAAALLGVLVFGGLNARILLQKQAWESTWRGWLPVARSGSPNIVLVILDTVRGASFGFMDPLGAPSPWPVASTPVMDSLAAEAVVFTRAVAPSPWTLPTHASIFTGRWPTELWGGSGLGAEWMQGLDGRHPTVAEVLARHGYMTGAFVGNLAFTTRETGLVRGFLEYRDYPRSLGQVILSTALGRRLEASTLWRAPLDLHELLNRKHAGDVVDGFLDWRAREDGRPYFAFLNFFDAHEPVFPPEEVKEALPPGSRWDEFHHFAGLLTGNGALRADKWEMDEAERAAHAAAYNAALSRVDAELGRLLREMAARPSPNPTVVVVTSDHGEQLGERGLYDHNNSLYLTALHVPLLVLLPGAEKGTVVRDVVSLRDLGATLLELAGVDAGRVGVGGGSLSRYWAAEEGVPPFPWMDATDGAPAFATLSRGTDNRPWYPVSWGPAMYTLVDSTHQYILNGDGSEELYRLAPGAAEAVNLAGDPSAQSVQAAFREELSRRVRSLPVFRGAVPHPLPPGREGG